MRVAALLGLAVGCSAPEEALVLEPVAGAPEFVVPSAVLPAEVVPQAANNNLSVTVFEGRTFLAFRTSETHFAGPETEMYVISSADGSVWTFEHRIALGTDVREPQLVPVDGDLFLYYAVLGDDPLDFEPQGTRRARRVAEGTWEEAGDAFDPTFIPWRMRAHRESGSPSDRPYLLGYTGGGEIYDFGEEPQPLSIHWLTYDASGAWVPVVPGQPVVLTGGGSESDFVWLDDGSIVAVVRNEAGDETGFGSKICTAPADNLGNWTCTPDPKKYDSPLLFRHGPDVWLVGRRNVTATGAYAVADPSLPLGQQAVANQVAYWQESKRCALWKVDPATRSVAWALDLPSAGDTCFPDFIERDPDSFEIWNYTSPVDQPDLSWLEGQNGETSIYRLNLDFVDLGAE